MQLLQQSVADTLAVSPKFDIDFLLPALSGSPERPLFHAPLTRVQGLKHIRFLLSQFYLEHKHPMEAGHVHSLGVHSFKVTVLSWAHQMQLPEDQRRYQGHHRASGGHFSVSLYSRDDVHPALALQDEVQKRLRAGFRPLQPLLRGAATPAPDFAVSLKPLDPAPEEAVPLPATIEAPAEPFSDSSSASSEASDRADDPQQDVPSDLASDLGEVDEYFWLVNPSSSVAHLAKQCALDDPLCVFVNKDDGLSYKFACGSRLCLTDHSLCLTTSLHPQRCLRFGCRKVLA